MEFPYIKVTDFPKHQPRQRLLPWVRVGIFNPKNPQTVVYPVGLVDSGSDVTLINFELGEKLGYEIEEGIKQEVKGFGGGTITGFYHKVGFIIEEPGNPKNAIKYTDFVIFSKNKFPVSMPQQTAIFGTIGFFRHLMVTFVFPKKVIIDTLLS